MAFQVDRVSVTTAADGSATAYSAQFTGYLVGVSYVKSDFTDGVDFTITTDTTAQGVWTETNRNASEVVYPTVALDGATGSTVTDPARGRVGLFNERVKIVIASGGNAKVGYFDVMVET